MTEPSLSGRRIARPYSVTPLPMPVFLTPQAMPANRALPVGVAHRQQRLLEADPGAELLSGAEAVADVQRVPPADLPAVDADSLGEQVEHALDREVRLVDAEAAHRARRAGCSCRPPSPRRRRSAPRRRRRRARRRARAPCRRRWRTRRCRRRCGRAPRRRRPSSSQPDRVRRATSDDAWSGSAGSPSGSASRAPVGRCAWRAATRGTGR